MIIKIATDKEYKIVNKAIDRMFEANDVRCEDIDCSKTTSCVDCEFINDGIYKLNLVTVVNEELDIKDYGKTYNLFEITDKKYEKRTVELVNANELVGKYPRFYHVRETSYGDYGLFPTGNRKPYTFSSFAFNSDEAKQLKFKVISKDFERTSIYPYSTDSYESISSYEGESKYDDE